MDNRSRSRFLPCTRAAMLVFITAIGLMASPVHAAADAASGALAREIRSLSPTIRGGDAALLAAEAHSHAGRLAREYRAVRAPQFHNFLVNVGIRKRGLCHHWTRDLGNHLAALKLRNLVFRWGIARAGTLREHSAVVVTAPGQPFERGIVLDAWRHSGRLFWAAVAADKYPWREDPHDSFAAAGAAQSPAVLPTIQPQRPLLARRHTVRSNLRTSPR